ncbi:MAG: aminotransferase class V-fold PLP-dependent enzyme, partial [Candidatus Liptonbacteria bacterium]
KPPRQRIANSKERIVKPYAISHMPLAPLVEGGGQEFGLRSGTENVPNIVGLAEALHISEEIKTRESVRIRDLRDYLWQGIRKIYEKARINGPAPDGKSRDRRLPNNLNVWLPSIGAEEAVVFLDLHGVAVSAGSACAARSTEPSHVLLAMGMDEKRARQSIRISLGRRTAKKEIDTMIQIVGKLVRRMKDRRRI